MNAELPHKEIGHPLYQQVADRVRKLITEGTLQPGDRLPSVRKLYQQLSVSISTILEAYQLLENQGWVRVRPQSGYYVKQAIWSDYAEPQSSIALPPAQLVKVSLAYQICLSKREDTIR
jgi:DNA-binding transcriptional regulator YhcF (GntR family)